MKLACCFDCGSADRDCSCMPVYVHCNTDAPRRDIPLSVVSVSDCSTTLRACKLSTSHKNRCCCCYCCRRCCCCVSASVGLARSMVRPSARSLWFILRGSWPPGGGVPLCGSAHWFQCFRWWVVLAA